MDSQRSRFNGRCHRKSVQPDPGSSFTSTNLQTGDHTKDFLLQVILHFLGSHFRFIMGHKMKPFSHSSMISTNGPMEYTRTMAILRM